MRWLIDGIERVFWFKIIWNYSSVTWRIIVMKNPDAFAQMPQNTQIIFFIDRPLLVKAIITWGSESQRFFMFLNIFWKFLLFYSCKINSFPLRDFVFNKFAENVLILIHSPTTKSTNESYRLHIISLLFLNSIIYNKFMDLNYMERYLFKPHCLN